MQEAKNVQPQYSWAANAEEFAVRPGPKDRYGLVVHRRSRGKILAVRSANVFVVYEVAASQ